ncbi:MAG: gamma-glutamyltransferase [Flavobacteriaceae bacterium TMED81]|nr:MAG: gamma-glutamyltransferase [Flavobacteriaceae bacterium TMED81]
MVKQLYHLILCIAVLTSCTTHNTSIQSSGTIGNHALVSSAHPLASAIGLEIMKNGGNAIDAAIATHFALAVVYPQAGNIGGGGFAVIRMNYGTINSLDFREKAPALAHREMYLNAKGQLNDMQSTHGLMASGVPGAVDGMFALHQKYGTLPMAELIEPSIEMAQRGYALTPLAAELLNTKQEEFQTYNRWSTPYHSDQDWQAGDTITQPDLALTLEHIQTNGRNGFYEGIVADQIVAEMQSKNGLISHADLKNYQSVWRKPITGNYRGHQIISMAPPSSGGVALIQLLQGTEGYPIADWGHNSTKTIHLMAELERRVYADRATYLGDPDFINLPVDQLLDPRYNEQRFSDISFDKATPSALVSAGEIPPSESPETTHLSIADADGNAVAITTTLNSSFGNKVMVKGAGFFLNNEMDDFSSKPGSPNQFGLIGGEANAIAPHKRMLSSMTPTIVTYKDQLKMIVGTPGGSTIITSVYQTLLNVIDHGMGMQEAVNVKRVHHQWYPDEIRVESDALTENVQTDLAQLGHQLRMTDKIGRMDCILVLPDGRLEGGADPRGDNTALGY